MTPRNGKYIMYVGYLCANFNLIKLEISISLFFSNLFLGKHIRKQVSKLLQKEYYNLKSSGSYFGPQKQYQSLKARGINDISVYKIRQWLNNQDDSSLQKPTRHPYKRARVVVSGFFYV